MLRIACLILALASLQDQAQGELLYNGIRLPATWPPKPVDTKKDLETPPYLQAPPAVIPIDVGRQLFVDDFLIAETTLKRTYHAAKYHPKTPVMKPDQEWELDKDGGGCAMAFSDGVWFDPKDRLFKMWYLAGPARHTCYATSKDGLSWEKPALDVKAGTNIVQSGARDSSTVWLDAEEKDPARRFKMFRSCSGGSTVKGAYGLATFFSPDGIHWSDPPLLTGSCGDRSTVFWNPFRKVWVYSIRHGWGQPRARRYWEMKDPAAGPQWSALAEAPMWVGSDSLDPQRDDYKVPCQLYNLDGTPYESLIVGLFTIWRGQFPDRQKPNEVCVGYSRDGWSWTRPDRRPFLPVSETFGDWNYSNVQSVGGGCLVMGDELWFYVSARSGAPKGSAKQGTCVTGLATLRRDGFASMDAGDEGGALTTRPLRYSGRHLYVNLDAPDGELRVDLLDGEKVVFSAPPVKGNGTRIAVAELPASGGKPLRFRMNLKKGRLYSFWVGTDPGGASGGYVGAGGPGFEGPADRK
ncbi:MAG: glycosyl hydrolase family 32 [Planctomycetes bacterium]|nr:glycosyl hydrolase family 32 [Planctomycetota bacterium]